MPLPMAMSGASGPSTAPQLRVTKAAMMMPGSSTGGTGPEALNPSAGACPPVPGRWRIVRPTTNPPSARIGSGHHTGAPSNPRSSGRAVKRYSCASATPFRKKYATVATTIPTTAPKTSSPT